MSNRIDEFQAYRQRINERILGIDPLGIKRFFKLDTTAYKDGPLDGKTKELLGLVALIKETLSLKFFPTCWLSNLYTYNYITTLFTQLFPFHYNLN